MSYGLLFGLLKAQRATSKQVGKQDTDRSGKNARRAFLQKEKEPLSDLMTNLELIPSEIKQNLRKKQSSSPARY